MSSGSAGLLGGQRPRVESVPKASSSEVDDAAFLAARYGLTPDDWQHHVLEGWMGRRADGRWAAGRCGLAVPRQNGKNGCIEIRELFGTVVLGERFLHTAHEVKTARKAFLRLASFFEDPNFPELAALVKEIRRTNGQEAIVLTNGGSVEYVARSRGSGRGYTVDVLVLDEAQELTDEQLEALLPTISAAPLGDPQVVMIGTPPGPASPGEVFTRTRDAGCAGSDKRLCWHEWSVKGVVDPTDRSLWAATNPALGGRLSVSVVDDELGAMSPDGFCRERLGRWAEDSHSTVISSARWAELVQVAPPTDGAVAFAVDMPPDRSMVAVAVARVVDGIVHCEVAKCEPTSGGVGWVAGWLDERWPNTSAVVIDAQSPAMSLLPSLADTRVKVTVTNTSEMVRACGMFVDAVRDGTMTHFGQHVLSESVANATKRAVGNAGGWSWNRRSTGADISPLVAVTLAHYGALTSTRKPGRKSRMVVMQ